MAGSGPLGVVIVGCGNISKAYARTMAAYPEQIRILGAYDIDRARSAELMQESGGRVYDTLDEVLSDPQVEAVINLTIHQVHVEVIEKCLRAGKHVHTEKPIAMDPEEAHRLVRLAEERKLRLSAAPITFMGEAQQTAWKMVRDGVLGTVRVIYAEMNWGRIERWHPNPAPFYEVGALYDVGVYPLTVLTAIFGPVDEVAGFGRVVYPDRKTTAGQPFTVTTPDWMCGIVRFASGPTLRLTTSFYVGATQQLGIELHGDTASVHFGQDQFHSPVRLRPFAEKDWTTQPPLREPFQGVDWARGVVELQEAIRGDRPQRATGAQAAHVVEVIAGIHRSAEQGGPVKIRSRFTPPDPMDWAR
jgi:predicted dehydrogenase